MSDVADLANLLRAAMVMVRETGSDGSQQECRYRCQRYECGDSEDSL